MSEKSSGWEERVSRRSPLSSPDHLSQGCEVTKSGNYIPHTLVCENLDAEEAHHLSCSWGHLILILLSESLKKREEKKLNILFSMLFG